MVEIIRNQPVHLVAALSLMNARNVGMETVQVNPKLKAARLRRGKPHGVEYHVLKLHPFASFRKQARSGDEPEQSGLVPIHWVRGHFKVYSEQRPLFGRYHGGFWWQPHLAGRDEQRIIEKSYEVA